MSNNDFLFWKSGPEVYLQFSTDEIPVTIKHHKGELLSATYAGEDVEPLLNSSDMGHIMKMVKRLA